MRWFPSAKKESHNDLIHVDGRTATGCEADEVVAEHDYPRKSQTSIGCHVAEINGRQSRRHCSEDLSERVLPANLANHQSAMFAEIKHLNPNSNSDSNSNIVYKIVDLVCKSGGLGEEQIELSVLRSPTVLIYAKSVLAQIFEPFFFF
ncbi:hypothetical protein CFP56_013187 [Quercus suber]|uniref:Uncharacterized protein n=1 Tax=Quercus suber TaxID=58331 RepID=A0AAW0KU46_QUESU